MEKTTLHEKLVAIQSELKVPKGQKNTFGNYKYRSLEDIETAVKPLLEAYSLTLTFSDNVVQVGDKNYIKAVATLSDGSEQIESVGYAREAESQKGMVDAQLTGSTSSYARKYAAGGLFLIDDTADADATNDHGKSKPQAAAPAKPAEKPMADYTEEEIMEIFSQPPTPDQVEAAYDNSGFPASEKQIGFITTLARERGHDSKYLNTKYGIEWPKVSNKLAKIIIDQLMSEKPTN